jgi:hypothetical protein
MGDFEQDFWGNCANTYGEETKQFLYMRHMGFEQIRTWRSGFVFDMGGRSVIDIGGGPCSVLLKCQGLARGLVVDPGDWPDWVSARYDAVGIGWQKMSGEELCLLKPFGLALIYNVLQHTEDPEKVVANASAHSKELRMFEWIDIDPHEGHPHKLTEAELNRWAGREGKVVELHGESECSGRAWVLGAPPPKGRNKRVVL